MEVSRKPKDRDFVRTNDDLLFCVVGYSHPPDRLLAYLKYVPSEKGLWASGSQHFQRMIPFYSSKVVSSTFSYLKEKYPQYLFYSPVNSITFSAVPHSEIKEYYKPEQKLGEMIERGSELDKLQEKAIGLAEYLSAESGVPIDKIGVTGSILLGIQNVSISDIDLTIYGRHNSLLLKQALIQEHGKTGSAIRKLTKDQSNEWCRKKAKQFSIDYLSAKKILSRKWKLRILHAESILSSPNEARRRDNREVR